MREGALGKYGKKNDEFIKEMLKVPHLYIRCESESNIIHLKILWLS